MLRQPNPRGSLSHAALLTAVVVLSACGAAPNAASSGAGSAPAEGAAGASAAMATEAEPLTFTAEADAATGTVTLEEGGTVTATASDGTTFELVVPPQAVPGDTEITLTPLSDMAGIDADAMQGVLLEPDGLEFHELARLTITPAEPIPPESQLMFEAAGDGENPTLALVDPTSEDIVILLDHFSVAGIATASEAQQARMLEKSAANAEARLSAQVRAQIGAERYRQLTGTGDEESGGAVVRDALEAIAAEFQREVLDKRKAAAEESCRALRQYVRTVIAWERQWQLAGVDESEEAASMARVVDAVEYAQARHDECQDEAIAACKDAGDPQILIDFWMWIEDPVDKPRAEETCLPQGFTLELSAQNVPLLSLDGDPTDNTLDHTATVTGCMAEDGTWSFTGTWESQVDYAGEDYPGDITGLEDPAEGIYLDITGGQTPDLVKLSEAAKELPTPELHRQFVELVGYDEILTITDALGEPTAVSTNYSGFGDPRPDIPFEVVVADPQCPIDPPPP
jgi:hypothetical protein